MENSAGDSKTAVDYLDPTNEPEPSTETGLGSHFGSSFDPSMKKNATRQQPAQSAPQASAAEKLSTTSSSMTTAQLQAAAAEGDPNNLQKKK
ncbi:uncharacterized protein RCC_09749 [Ramularia collo-cygni]|uniref:Uncharacterized protein n=1 Tax=Ramularia collo-cygni TaxID=112498 RepID=A0A2D3VFT8_9PEZI|nr:uncharacterized protein RCC_09749 [Ramularia collo-cygni]CZT24032.1 uncharacterized protein RCC_09749 [Ramularia collo-cygni]